MKNAENVLEFDKIKDILEQMAYTPGARKQIRLLSPCLAETELKARLRETSEAKLLLEQAGTPPLTSLEGMEELMETAVKGGCLTADQLEKAAGHLTAVKRLKEYLNHCKQFEIGLPYYEENLDSMEDLRKEIREKIRGGRVDDFASKQLRSLRSDIEQAHQKMREKADSVMRANKACMSDSFSTIRNGRICIPVKKEYRNKISGSVIDKSSTGNTLFIEPKASAKYFEELQLLKIEEENEVYRILYTLSAMVADSAEGMEQNARTLEKLDFMFAKAKLSADYGGTEPEIVGERSIRIVNARHPLMDRSVNIPLNFQIGGEIQGVLITGPNTGGKTVAIKTVALNCMMAQCGLHTACESAQVCMNSRILCDIGDGQDISENLSTFSAHITNILDILKKAGPDTLVVLDELGSGTDPAEGMGIAIAVLEQLKQSGALYLVTTHYPEVKRYAEQTQGVINARMAFDKESLKPLYRLEIGEAGESCAFYIAQKLGMPGNMLRRAALAAYGEENADAPVFHQGPQELSRERGPRIQKKKTFHNRQTEAEKFSLGDSVMVYPDKKIGIVCSTANEKGVLRVQLAGKKIWISHKRIELLVAADRLYPEDYDFSIVFDSVAVRKARHDMGRKHMEDTFIEVEE